MHKAKTSRLPRIITSLLVLCGLVLGGSVVVVAPAQAITNGCIQSGFQPNNCSSEKTPISDIIAITGGAGSTTTSALTGTCTTATFVLNYATSNGLTATSGPIAGLVFSTTTTAATLSGTAAGTLATTNFIIMATCQDSSRIAYSFSVTVTASATPIILPSTQSLSATTNSAITNTATFTATNFTAAPTYTVAPALPAGLSLNASTGVISGTPTAAQASANYTITATYAAASQTSTSVIAFEVTNPVVPAVEPPPPSRKVTICHRTHATTNPYVRITVDYNAVNRKSGHQGHDEIFAGEHVFKAGIYKRAKDKDWGDIIPADPSGLNRWQPLNWTTLGAQIYNGTVAGCPSYDPVAYYNAQREAGVPEKKLKQEMAEIEEELKEGNPGTSRVDPATLKYTGNNSAVAEQETDKVTICHRTNATTNPYRRITVSVSSVMNKSGHMGHDEIYNGHHVFDSTVTYPNNKKDWGDIIPADPTGKNRWQPLNWTALGQLIYNGTIAGCSEMTTQQIYNALREDEKPRKDVIKELEEQKNVDDDPKDIDESEYTGEDPKTKESEPKPPVDPNPNVVAQSLSGIVWLDLNRDGLKDQNEPFMPNIKLSVVQLTSVQPSSVKFRAANLRNIRPAAVVTVNTDANGYYIFPSLGAGDWQVVTGIPEDLSVTYDSQALGDGEIIATVPVASHAYTWVGLVGDDGTVDEKYLKEILEKNPDALPLSEIPPTLRKQILAIIEKNKSKTDTGNELADTGTPVFAWFVFGLFLMLAGAGVSRIGRKRN